MMSNDSTQWLRTLFGSFVQDSSVKLYFEQKEKLLGDKTALNLSVHPVRFADDVFFNFETNSEDLRKKLKKHEVNYDMFYYYADVVRATYLKSIKNKKYKTNALLLVGQTERDKVIFDGQKYLSVLDYLPRIKELSKQYDHIYFKPHPYAKNSKKIFKALRSEVTNLTVVYDNVYHLLSDECIKGVVALNSSVLYEAKYFHKNVEFLYKPYFDMDGKDIGVYGDYFSSSFWADILDVEDTGIRVPLMQNRLRKSLNDFWGYNEISEEIILKDIIKSKVQYFLSKYVR